MVSSGFKHTHSSDDLTVLSCARHGWSRPLTRVEMARAGIPWHCGLCGQQTPHFIVFHPSERAEAELLAGNSLRDEGWMPA